MSYPRGSIGAHGWQVAESNDDLWAAARSWLHGADPDELVTITVRRVDARAVDLLLGSRPTSPHINFRPGTQERRLGEQLMCAFSFAASHGEYRMAAMAPNKP